MENLLPCASRACPRLAAVRRRLSANEVTPDSRPGCYRGVELSCPKRRHTDSFRMALSVCSPPVLHGITSGLSPDPSSRQRRLGGVYRIVKELYPPVSYDLKGPRSCKPMCQSAYGQPASTPFGLCCPSLIWSRRADVASGIPLQRRP